MSELFEKYYSSELQTTVYIAAEVDAHLSPTLPEEVQELVNREIPAQIMVLETSSINLPNIIECREAAIVLAQAKTMLERLARQNARIKNHLKNERKTAKESIAMLREELEQENAQLKNKAVQLRAKAMVEDEGW